MDRVEKMSLKEAQALNDKGALKKKVLTERGWYLPRVPEALQFRNTEEHVGKISGRRREI